ncbi:MAG: hypothetical protein JSV65_08175 [Armatimonadota bacterium]|nr:MAG: hypothetical protein JSV65_08175 [Armatimonadota bacterium]
MTIINSIMTTIFDVLLRPFSSLSPWYGIAAVSLVTGVVMLMIFRHTSNQRAIRRAKDRIRAHLLEVRLYRDDVRVLLRAQKDILLTNLRYLGYSLMPLLVMIIPVVLILVQLNAHYGYRPLRPGDSAIVAVRFAQGFDLDAGPPQLAVPPGLKAETPPLRIPAEREVDWRIGAERPGRYAVRIVTGDQEVEKAVIVSNGHTRVTPRRVGTGWWDIVMNPGEKPLPADSAIRSIAVDYEPAALPFLGWDIHWLVAFFILSIAFGFALKGLFRVEV